MTAELIAQASATPLASLAPAPTPPPAGLFAQAETQRLLVTGIIQLFATLVGGAISAFVAVRVATQSSTTAHSLEAEKNARLDHGIRRQVLALIRSVGPYVRTGRRFGILRTQRWSASFARLRDRLVEPDAALAFTDEQSFAIYHSLDSCELALRAHLDNETAWDRDDEKRPAGTGTDQGVVAQRTTILQGTYKPPCDDLRALWKLFASPENRATPVERKQADDEVKAFDEVEAYLATASRTFPAFEKASEE